MEMRPSGLGKSICTPQLDGNFTYYIRIRYVELARPSVYTCVCRWVKGQSKPRNDFAAGSTGLHIRDVLLNNDNDVAGEEERRERERESQPFARVDRQTFSNAPNSGVSCLPRPPQLADKSAF